MEVLNLIICGIGLDNNGWACFNITHSSLKGEALCVFNDKAAEQKEEMRDTHIQCLHAITEHVFPKDNLLLKQKMYMHNHMFLYLNAKLVSEFHTRWVKINNYLDKFPPFQPNQHFLDNQTKDIFYNIIPKHWKSFLQCDKFDIIASSANDFFNRMECYQLADQLDPSLKQQNKLKLIKMILRSQQKS